MSSPPCWPPRAARRHCSGDLGHRRADRADRRERARTRRSRGGRGPHPAAGAGRLLARLHGREHAVRGPRPAGIPAARARPAGRRLGGRRARPPRWTSWAPPSCARCEPGELHLAGRAGRAVAAYSRRPRRRCACSSTSTWPGRTPRSAGAGCTRPGSRSAGRWPPSTPPSADLVIPVPESGTPAAIGYAEASGIPYGQGLVKNSYVGRTFIQPSQTIRQLGIRLKLNPLRDVIAGRGSWLSTTRSCAGTPSRRSWRCCARRARARCTCGSRRRR